MIIPAPGPYLSNMRQYTLRFAYNTKQTDCMGFKRPEVQILSPRPKQKPWYNGKRPGISGFFVSTESIISSQANAFYARFVRLEFHLRGKIVVVCGECTPSCPSEDWPISRICPTSFETRPYTHSRISLYSHRSRIPAVLSAVCLILPTLNLKG